MTMENSNGVPSPPLNNGAFDTGSTTQSNTPIVQSNAQDLTDQIKGNEINNRQNFNSKMIETSVEETPGVLSTLAALQFAANSVTLLVCSSNHLMSLIEASKSGMLELIKGVRKRLDNTNFSAGKIDFGPREASYDLDIFSRELGKIVDSVGLLESSLISQVDDIRRRWLPLLHALFFCGTAAVLSGRQEDPFINGAEADNFKVTFLQSFLPVACAFWLAANRLQPSLFPTEQPGGDWLEGGWNMMCLSSIIYNTENSQLVVRLDSLPDTIKLLARMLRILLPWCSEEKPDTEIFERHGFELRADRELSILIDAGLSCPDPSIRKESMYVVKQTVRFGALYMQPGNLKSIVNLEDHPFLWAPSERVAMARDWRAFCLLYEAVSSTETHFVEPALPMIRSIMADDSLLPCRWWSLLVRRAQMNDSINIRILFIRAILQLPVGELKRLQLATRSFVYETLIPALDNGQLYAQSPARSDGAYEVSEFGMCVACFLSATLLTGAPANFGADATRLLKCISEDIRSPTAILFMLQSFVLLPRTRLLKESDGFISYMRRIATNPVLGSHKARRLARWQLLQAFLQLVDPNNISFDQLATLLTDLITEKGPDKVSLKLDCIEYVAVRNWLIASYGAMYVPQKVSSAIETFLICPDSSENNPIESSRGTTSESQNNCMEQIDSQNLKNISRNNSSDSDNLNCPESIATMLIFSLEENNSDGFSASIKPLLDKMDELTAANCGKNPERVFVLFHALDDAVRAATGNKQDLLTSTNVQAKVYEWLAIIVSLLLPSKEGSVSMGGVNDSEAKEKSHQDLNSTNLSGSNNSNTQTYKTEFLNDGFKHLIGTLRLLLERASTQPEALVAYLDIVLYKVVALVAKFDEQRVNEVAESIDAQVQKTAALELMDAALHALDEANTHHLGFLLDGTVDHVFSMTLMKPPGLTDTQMLGWRDLQTTFTTSKWSLIGTLAHFSTRCMELQGKVQLDKIFLECLNNLEDAKYRSVLSIYSCMQVLVSIDPKSDHELLNKVDDSTTDVPANNNQISELTSGQSNVNGNDDIKNSDTNFILRKKNEPKNNDIGLELVKKAFEVSKNVIGEVSDSPAWHYLYMQSFIDFMFQPQTVLMRPDLEAVIKDSIDWIMTIGGRRQNIVTRLANNLQVSWSSTNYPSDAVKKSRNTYKKHLTKLSHFGPERPGTEENETITEGSGKKCRTGDEGMQQNNSKQNPSNAEERHSVSLAVLNAQELTGRGRAAVIEALSRGSDYLVRVNMNSVLLQLDPNDAEDHKLAMDVLDELLADIHQRRQQSTS